MTREYAYREIKESKLFMDKKPPAFGVIITLITLFFLSGILILAAFATKTYVVKASGIVMSEDKAYIMNSVSSSIKAVKVIEGQEVKIGDVLIELDDFSIRLQIEQMTSSNSFISSKAMLVEKLILFVNNFTLANAESRVNPFDCVNANEAKQFGEAKQFIDFVDQQIASAEEKKDTPEYKEYTQADVDAVKDQFLSQQYTTLEQYSMQKIDYESKIKMYKDRLSEYVVRAKTSGVVHFSNILTVGTVLQAGSMLGIVSAKEEDKLYLETIVSAQDRSKIKVEDSVEIAIAGVLQNEYGVLSGKIIAIDNDSTQTEKGEVFYKVKIKAVRYELTDKKGNVVKIANGMLAECRIKYDETTWLKWAIGQIGVKFK